MSPQRTRHAPRDVMEHGFDVRDAAFPIVRMDEVVNIIDEMIPVVGGG